MLSHMKKQTLEQGKFYRLPRLNLKKKEQQRVRLECN